MPKKRTKHQPTHLPKNASFSRQGKPLIEQLTEKERAFLLEYLVDYNRVRAVKAAGYTCKNNGVAASRAAKILAKPAVQSIVGKLEKESQEKFEIERDAILKRLYALCTRDARKYLNDMAVLDPYFIKHNLPSIEAAAIDGIKQRTVHKYTEEDGTQVEIVETEVKLSPIAAAIRMAMEHKGLFAPSQQEVLMRVDEAMFRRPEGNPVQHQIDQLESQAVYNQS